MRLSYVLFVAAAALVGTLDATSAASGATLSKLSTANAENIGGGHRFLRKHEVVEDDDTGVDEEEEERGWLASKTVMAKFAVAHTTNNMGEMQKILREVQDSATIKYLYTWVKPMLTRHFPDYDEAMGPERFQLMIANAEGLSDDLTGMLTAAYSKYYAATYLK
ncbi:hypothetical protein KRP22_006219 [Phytophthora ramorum]|nr:RxLR effector protein [Phytophthora ramorum]